MMISPEAFALEHENDSYAELLALRDELIKDMREYESSNEEIEEMRLPSPETIYLMNCQYLGKLCELIAVGYMREFVPLDNE